MTIKTILVCLTSEEAAETVLKPAVALARQHGAHLIGIHTLEALVVYPGIAMHVPGDAHAIFNQSQDDHAKAIEKIFEKYTKNEDFVSEWRLSNTYSTSAADRIIENAHAADLVIVAQADKENDRVDQYHLQDRLIRESGRPVMVIPPEYDGEAFGKTVLVGWSDTASAVRAAHDAQALMEEGAQVHILRVSSRGVDEMRDFAANDMAASMARHGLKTNVIHRTSESGGVSEMLMKEALDQGADLIVTGAFGHSRFYDFVIGAVTRDLLKVAPLPVLFSM